MPVDRDGVEKPPFAYAHYPALTFTTLSDGLVCALTERTLSVDPRFATEYEACAENSSYEVALCNIEDCIAGDALVIDKVSSRKATYSLLRTMPTWRTTYERIEQALKHNGYKLIVNWNAHHRYSWTDLKFLTSAYAEEIPEAHRSYIPPDTQKADWRAYYFDGVFFFGTRLRRGRKDDEPSIELLSCAEGSARTKYSATLGAGLLRSPGAPPLFHHGRPANNGRCFFFSGCPQTP